MDAPSATGGATKPSNELLVLQCAVSILPETAPCSFGRFRAAFWHFRGHSGSLGRCPKLPEIARQRPNVPEIARNRPTAPERARNCPKAPGFAPRNFGLYRNRILQHLAFVAGWFGPLRRKGLGGPPPLTPQALQGGIGAGCA
eukprot:6085478-Alexandrium_andersonii.AAC.2